MIEHWLLKPHLEPEPEEPLKVKQGGDATELVHITVPGRGGFYVMRPLGGEIRREFVSEICEYLYGKDYEWFISDSTPESTR